MKNKNVILKLVSFLVLLFAGCNNGKYVYTSTCKLNIDKTNKDGSVMVELIDKQFNDINHDKNSMSCNVFLGVNQVMHDTLNLIDLNPELSKDEVLEHSKKSNFLFILNNKDTCINIKSYINIDAQVNRKYKTYIGNLRRYIL